MLPNGWEKPNPKLNIHRCKFCVQAGKREKVDALLNLCQKQQKK